MKKFFKLFLDVGICVSILFQLGSYASYFFSSSTLSVVSILGLLFRPVFYGAFLLCLIAYFSKRPLWKLQLLILLLGLYFWPLQYQFIGSQLDTPGEEIKTATFNMQFSKPLLEFEGAQFDLEKKKLKALLQDRLKDHDILSVQECGYLSTPFIKALDFEYMHSSTNKTVHLFSRYPIINSGEIRISMNQVNTCIWAELELPNKDTVRVYNVHMESNRFTGVVPKTINQGAKEKMSIKVAWGLLSNFNKFTFKRQKQLEQILKHMDESPYKCIISGDFNDPAMTYNYRLLNERFEDTFNSAEGWGTSLKSRFIKMRIDYIWLDETFKYGDYTSELTPYSDHAIVSSSFSIP